MHPQPVRRVQDHPPVAQFVAEPLYQQRGVGGDRVGGRSLVVQQLPQVFCRIGIETQSRTTPVECVAVQAGQLAGERAERRTELGGPSDIVAAPERQPGRLARRGDHQHPVMGDLGDPPAGGAQRDDITRTRLVDHFLVEFAYPRRLFGLSNRSSEVDGEQPAIGDGAAGGDGQSLGTGPRGQRAGLAVVDQTRSQLGELGRRILAGQQVQGGLIDAAWQGRERRAAAYRVEPPVGVQRLQRGRRHGVLRQDVERVGGHSHRLDLPGEHPLHGHRATDQVGAMLGKQHAARDFADLMAGPPDALQAAGHRRRRLHLNHQVDGTHVDAQFQARRRDHRLEQSTLEIFFDHGTLLLADRTVVGARQHSVGT